MGVNTSLRLAVAEGSEAGQARRRVAEMARRLGFSDEGAGKAALIATEAAGNLVKHTANGGQLIVQPLEQQGVLGLDILALDQSSGITNVARALRDGHSTAGSPGTGLGAISRLSDHFEIQTAPGTGTAILARLWSRPLPGRPALPLDFGVVCVPKPGEEACGDAWAFDRRPGRDRFLVADGLGHGPAAATASAEAVRTFNAHSELAPAAMIDAMHDALRGTRGAEGAVVEVDSAQRVIRYAGIGNIQGIVVSPEESHNLISYNGIVGQSIAKTREFTYPWPDDAVLVLNSDGLGSRWDLARYPGLARRHPALIAGVLYRDFARGNDDATVLVVKDSSAAVLHREGANAESRR